MTERTRVWYLIGELAVGGTERTLIDLVSGLDRERFEPTIWTISQPGPLAKEVPQDVPVRSLNATCKIDLRAVVRFLRAIRRERPNVLQSFLFFDNVLARIAGIFARNTTVITGVRMVPDSVPRYRDIVDRLTLPLSDIVVSNSQAGTEWAIERGASPEQTYTIPNGRDVEAYNVSVPPHYRESLGIPAGPIVGTVGRLVHLKGHHDLLEAWPKVLEDHPNAHLIIVGDGSERQALETHIKRLGIDDIVHLIGWRNDIPELLNLFDVFAFPSHVEGLPGALLEAMCAGRPIVTTPVGGSTELIEDGEQGLHVPPRDPVALAQAITRLISDENLAKELSGRARTRAKQKFSLAAMVAKYESLLETSQ